MIGMISIMIIPIISVIVICYLISVRYPYHRSVDYWYYYSSTLFIDLFYLGPWRFAGPLLWKDLMWAA